MLKIFKMRLFISYFVVLLFVSCQKEDVENANNMVRQELSIRAALLNPLDFNKNNIGYVYTESVPSGQTQSVKFGAFSKDNSLNSFLVNGKNILRSANDQSTFGNSINASDPEINSFESKMKLSMDGEICEFEPIS